jgi:1-acyl-sn-glycerol-3-phosphate acyltransferase
MYRACAPWSARRNCGAPHRPRSCRQYTSGSTGNPKGVILTHANLLANIRAMGETVRATSTDVFVSWMPLYHDMGLIGAWLGSLYFGMPLVVMSPLTFLAHPQRWLWAIHQHRATLSGAPNFGYELCLRKVDEAARAGLDLSSWRLAFNGAEPVSPDTLAHFAARFARYGLRPEALAPVYGLAECALGLAFPPPGRAPVIDRVARERFLHSGQALPAAADDATALRFVGCGQVLPDHAIRIVGETGTPLGERRQGRVEFRGPSTTSGYYRNPEVTAQLFDDGWLDSGDLGYLADSELYLTGRVKDVIIRAGRNVHPQELEEAVGNVSGIRKGCVAVFGARPAGATAEQLIVLAEIRAGTAMSAEALRATINDLALRLIGMPPDDIVLAAPHTVLKTSSGKIRRAASRELYERGLLRAPTRPPWRQLLAVTWTAAWPELRRGLQQLGGIGFAVYTWLLFAVLAPFTWALVSLLPHAPAQRTIHRIARLFIALSGTPLTVRGREHLPAGPCMLVANHASYLDGIILTAVLAPGFAYVAKREFLTQFIARVFLRAIGAEFVERFEAGRGVEDAARLTACLRAGATLLVFPEGGFRRAPGLLPFRLGAFVAAGDAGVRVVPCALRGTRGVLRAGSWWPRRGAITLTVGAPLTAHGTDFRAALQLRDAARAAVLRDCGEPDLTALRV